MSSFDLSSIDRRWLLAGGGVAAIGGLIATGQRLTVPNRLDPAAYLQASRIVGDRFPFRIEDPSGASLTIKSPPQRVITTGWPSDEAMYLLTAGKRVVSVGSSVDDPGISNVAGLYDRKIHRNKNKLEEVIALEPDLIITGASVNASYVTAVMGSGIPVLRFAFYESFQSVDDNLRLLARLVGAEAQADLVLADMWSRLAKVTSAVEGAVRPRVLWADTGARPGSLYDETLTAAGALNVAREAGNVAHPGEALPKELQFSLQPDVIFYGGDWGRGKLLGPDLKTSPDWKDVPAVKNGRVYSIHMAWCTTGSPYRIRGVEQMARYLHPDRFTA